MDLELEALVGATEAKVVRCEGCGRDHKKFPHRLRNGRIVWAAPKLNPCKLCGGDREAQPVLEALAEREALEQRMQDAGVPDPLWAFSIEEADLLPQQRGEADDAFMARCRATNKTGVHRSNMGALELLQAWEPPKWLLLHGPVGVGKTAWMAGLIRRLLTRQPMREVVDTAAVEAVAARWGVGPHHARPLPGQVTFRRAALPRVHYARVDELVDRERLKWAGDREPLKALVDCPILFLDELGIDEEPDKLESKLLDRVLGGRHDQGRCTVFATNRPADELVREKKPLYGKRVASRLRTATVVGLGGPSWRS